MCQIKFERTDWKNEDWVLGQYHEGVHDHQWDLNRWYFVIARLDNSHTDFCHAGLHTSKKEEILLMSRSRSRVWHSKPLDDRRYIISFSDGPAERKAFQATEDIALVIETNNSDHLILIHTELPVASLNVETHYGANFNLAS